MGGFNTDHLGVPEFSAGPSAGFLENFDAAYDQQYQVDSAFGLEFAIQDRWVKSVRNYERKTGEKVGSGFGQGYDIDFSPPAIMEYVRELEGEETPFMRKPLSGKPSPLRENFRAFQQKVAALNDPEIETFANILADVKANRNKISAQTAGVSETSSVLGTIGGFAGAVAGSFSERDPLLVASLGWGGFGKSVAARIATEAGVGAAIEGVQQFAFVQPTRELIGEAPSSPWESIFYAAAGAGVIRGGAEGVGRLLGGRRVAEEPFTLEDSQLRQMFEANPKDPNARAGLHALDSQWAFDEFNPYGKSDVAARRFHGEIEEVYSLVSGKTDTAVARVLPELPVDLDNLSLDMRIVKEEKPVIYDRLVRAQVRLSEIDDELNTLTSSIDNLAISDAVTRIDPDSGALVKSFEDDLRNPGLTSEARAAIETRISQVVETLGPERVAKELNDAAIAPRKNLQTLRASRTAAKKEHTAARKDVDREINLVQVRAKLSESLAQQKALKTFAPTLSGSVISKSVPGPGAAQKVLDTLDATETQVGATASTALPLTLTDSGDIDLGNGLVVSKDFELDITDSNGNTVTITAADSFAELTENAALLEAVRVCSI